MRHCSQLGAWERFEGVVERDGPHKTLLFRVGLVVFRRPAADEADALLVVSIVQTSAGWRAAVVVEVVAHVVGWRVVEAPIGDGGTPRVGRGRPPLAGQGARILRALDRVRLGIRRSAAAAAQAPAAAATAASSRSPPPSSVATDQDGQAQKDRQTADHREPDDERRRGAAEERRPAAQLVVG